MAIPITIVGVGKIARDCEIKANKLCSSSPVTRKLHVIRRLMIICLQERCTSSSTISTGASDKEH